MTHATPAHHTATGPELAQQAGIGPIAYLRSRGFVHDVSDEDTLNAEFANGPVTLYIGFDPTATSLHVGNLVGIMLMANLQRFGHRPIALAGGGTVMIGDPSGKSIERQLLTVETIEQNLVGIRQQLSGYLDYDGGKFGSNPPAIMRNNADWLLKLELIPFLRDIGKHFSVNEMLASETYRVRMETVGLSFIEFNYRVLQAFDYLHLFRSEGCILQCGGSDQWGNITAGTDLIRRVTGSRAHVLVTPLITTSSGQKMGKSEGNAVWLDPQQTSPFQYYQFWRNTTDEDVARFLRIFTFVSEPRIQELTATSGVALGEAKDVLAWEATALTHGDEAANEAAAASRALFTRGGGADTEGEIDESALFASDAGLTLPAVPTMNVSDLFIKAGLASSRNEVRRLVDQGGLTINGERVGDANGDVDATGAAGSLVLRAGKKRVRYVRFA